VNLRKADEEAATGVEVREIIATHRAVRLSLRTLWVLSLLMIVTSAVTDWMPGTVGGAFGSIVSSVVLSLHERKKIK
jgi:hypothetical protein